MTPETLALTSPSLRNHHAAARKEAHAQGELLMPLKAKKIRVAGPRKVEGGFMCTWVTDDPLAKLAGYAGGSIYNWTRADTAIEALQVALNYIYSNRREQ